VNYNYTPQPGKKLPYPRLVTSNIIVINPLELLEVAKDVGKFDVDLLQPDNDTENWIRKKCGMPLKSKTSRPRWAPIQTRLQEQEEGEVPVEPGAELDKEGRPLEPGGVQESKVEESKVQGGKHGTVRAAQANSSTSNSGLPTPSPNSKSETQESVRRGGLAES